MIEELRVKEWIDKVFLIFIASFLVTPVINWNKISFLGLFLVYLIVLFSYIYLLNSFFDKDRKIFPKRITQITLIVLGFISFVLPLFTLDFWTIFFGLTTLFLATFYSAPPLRFKARGFWGLTAALFQYSLPFLVFSSLISKDGILIIVISLNLLFLGILKIVIHQIEDYLIDSRDGLKTIITLIGPKSGLAIVYFILKLLVISYVFLFFLFDFLFALKVLLGLIVPSIPSFLYIRKVIKNESKNISSYPYI